MTIAAEWDYYRQRVVPATASRTQVVETKRAFYAGATVALASVYAVGKEDVAITDGMATIEALLKEASAFAASVRAGES